jgi:hypothetical protein
VVPQVNAIPFEETYSGPLADLESFDGTLILK